jgi:hypothetical protein
MSFYLIIILVILIILNFVKIKFKREKPKDIREHQKKIFIREIIELEDDIKDNIESDTILDSKKYCELARKYHHGVPDTYINDELVSGVTPDIQKAIEYYTNALLGGEYECALELASIYHYGVIGFNVHDTNKALKIYEFLLENGDNTTKLIAQDRINELQRDQYQIEFNVPEQIQQQVNTLDNTTVVQPFIVNDFPDLEAMMIERMDIPIHGDTLVDTPTRNDTQNVHNSGVTKTTGVSIEKLKEDTPITINSSRTFEEIRAFTQINPNISAIRKQNALQVLNFIETHNELLVSVNMREVDLITLIWNRINQLTASGIQGSGNLAENLINELSECIEKDTVVCVTGRVTHIIDSLNGIDPLVEIKPQWVLNQELLSRASLIFKEYTDNLSKEDATIFKYDNNELSTMDKSVADRQAFLCNDIKKIIRKKLKEEYVDTKLMSEELLEVELIKWLDQIC